MKELFIRNIGNEHSGSRLKVADNLIDQTDTHPISLINWKEFEYQPLVQFQIVHTEDEVWLKYKVTEETVRATESVINGEVYKDSCVEFFISFDRVNYYNFEFNCIGTPHVAYGPLRENRQLIKPDTIKKMIIASSLGSLPFGIMPGLVTWELMVQIPKALFVFDHINMISGKTGTCNLYKCGDDTAKPHFLSWNPIHTPNPDFHRPQFFGNLCFE